MELSLKGISEPFVGMLLGLQHITAREEMVITQIPSPKGIAPESLALSIEVSHDLSSDHGASRLVFCRDSSQKSKLFKPVKSILFACVNV